LREGLVSEKKKLRTQKDRKRGGNGMMPFLNKGGVQSSSKTPLEKKKSLLGEGTIIREVKPQPFSLEGLIT